MRKELSLAALKEAITLRQPKEGWIHHSDRGSQYCVNDYVETLVEAVATIGMSRKGNPYDNSCMESFFASLKKEYLYKCVFKTKAEAVLAIEFYIKFYNKRRMHSLIDYMCPREKELVHQMGQHRGNANEQLGSASKRLESVARKKEIWPNERTIYVYFIDISPVLPCYCALLLHR